MDFLKIMARTGAILFTHSFSSLGCIPSGPAALFGLSSLIFLFTFSVVIQEFLNFNLVDLVVGSGTVDVSSLVKTLEK